MPIQRLREKADGVPFDAITWQRRYRLKIQQDSRRRHADRVMYFWCSVTIASGVLLALVRWL